MPPKRRIHFTLIALVWACMPGATTSAQPVVLQGPSGKTAGSAEAAPLDPKQRSWRLGEFSSVRLVPREPGAAANQHPASWSAESLRQQLAPVRAELRGGAAPLFDTNELAELVGPLSQALALAGPGDDVLLLSTHRRGSGILVAPFAVTARLFVQDGGLQLIVHDARLDFMDTYIGTRVPPNFTFGSRTQPGPAVLQGAQATSRRADWLSLLPGAAVAAGSAGNPAASAAAVVQPAPAPAPVPAPVRAAVPAVNPKPASASPEARPRDAAAAEEAEQRLVTLKRLFDKGLISEAEYQQMRKEVLQGL